MSGVARLSAVLLVMIGLSACGGGGSGVTLESILVTSASPSAVAGGTLQLTAIGSYSDGNSLNVTSQVSWTSDSHSVATINNAGLAYAIAPGNATITAMLKGVSGSTGVIMTPPTFSGAIAAGAPLVGTVTVKDSVGTERSAPIGANGSYSLDVWGMTAPLMLRADGIVGTTHYVIYSAASTIGLGGMLNITPLTDLIIDNIAGQLATAYYANGNFSSLTQPMLDAESAALKAKLLPVLQAMGVDASIDLLHTPFTPLASALDAALDVLRVSIDPVTNVATILNVVNQASITDNIAVPVASEGTPPVLSAAGTEEAADDVAGIRKVLNDFMDLFKTSKPAWQSILPLLSDTFLHEDQNAQVYADYMNDSDALVGGSISDIQFTRFDYTYNSGTVPLALISFNFNDRNGKFLERVARFTMIRGSDGKWLMNGDRSLLAISMHVHQVNDINTGCRASGLDFHVEDRDTSNSTNIAAVLISGRALPTFTGASPGYGAIWIDRDIPTGTWHLRVPAGKNPSWYPMTGGCNHSWADWGVADDVIAAATDPVVYFFNAYNFSTVEVPLSAYTGLQYGGRAIFLRKRPMTLVEANASTKFPTFTTSPALATYAGGNFSVNVANANPLVGTWVYLGLTASGNLLNTTDVTVTPAADGTFSTSLSLTSPGNSITYREVRVATTDEYDRTFMSTASYSTVP